MMNKDYKNCLEKILEKLDEDVLFELDWEIYKLRELLNNIEDYEDE